MIRLVAMDVDGTLLSPEHMLTPRVREAVGDARAAGLHVCLATGKLFASIASLVHELGLTGPQITCNGAALVDAAGGPPLMTWPLTPGPLAAARAALADVAPRLAIAWYSPERIYTDAPYGPLDEVLAQYHEPPMVRVASFDEDAPPPVKLLVTDTPVALDALRRQIEPRLTPEVHVVRTSPEFLEFMEPGVDKGQALREVMRRLGVVPQEVTAIGDGENDIPLLKAAGTAVAMGNAMNGVREHAHRVTATNAEDGVALILEELAHQAR